MICPEFTQKTDLEYTEYAKSLAKYWADLNPQISSHFGFAGLLERCLLSGYSDYCRIHGLKITRSV